MNIFEKRRRITLGVVFAVIVAGSFFLFRTGIDAEKMIACLPQGDGPTFYVNVSMLRRTGILEHISGPPGHEEADYLKFVQGSGFNYRNDLDAALIRFTGDGPLMVLYGKFHRDRLEQYARVNGGRCANGLCAVQASTPDRQISFQPIRSDLLGVAVGHDPMGAALITAPSTIPPFQPPAAPVWLYLPGSSLRAQEGLPPGVSAFLSALQGAERAFLTLELTQKGFETLLIAPCPDPAKATEVARRLTDATSLLKALIAREGKTAAPGSVAAILSSGTFTTDKHIVRGIWPIPLTAIEGIGK